MNLVEYKGKKPVLGQRVYVDPQATLIGDVVIEDGVGIWPGAVIRADEAKVILEKGAMVLENAVIEAASGKAVTIKSGSIISHGAIIHGASVGNNCTVGIGATLMDNSTSGDYTVIGAGALVTPGKKIPAKKLVIGIPGKEVKDLDSADLANNKKEWELLDQKLDEYIKIRGIAY